MGHKEILVEVKNLKIAFGKGKHKFMAINDVSFTIFKGEIFGLVGESGSGKTTIGRAIMRINDVTEGRSFIVVGTFMGKLQKAGIGKLPRKSK